MPPYKRYYTDYDRSGLTAEELSVRPEDEQINYMVAWFNHYFDNPMTTGLPREDDNYVYDWGGPYEADDELDREFNTFLDEAAISKAVARVDAGGIGEWAPSDNHPDKQVRPSKRYYTAEDYDGLTPSQLKRASKADQIRYMKHWFWTYYEDPSASMPHISREGGFQYIWGGPYDAMEELFHEFDGTVSESRIREAAESVQSDGTYDWAPSPEHPNRREDQDEFQAGDELSEESPDDRLRTVETMLDNGVEPSFDSGEAQALVRELRETLKEFRDHIDKLKPAHGGKGHNNPPPDAELEPVEEAKKAAEQIDQELAKDKPDPKTIVKSAWSISRFLKWIGKKIGEAAASKAGEVILEKALDPKWLATGLLIASAVQEKVIQLLESVHLPF